MKLLHYTYRKLSLFFLFLVTLWGILFYYTLMDEVIDETDDMLQNKAHLLIKRVLADESLLQTKGDFMSLYHFKPISRAEGVQYNDKLFDSTAYIELEKENEPVRVYQTAFCMYDGQYYELTVMVSTLEQEDMLETIFFYLGGLFLLFLLLTGFGTRTVLKRVFRQLDNLMSWLHNITPEKPIEAIPSKTKIREFRELEDAIYDMGNRSHKAYEEQKQFIENASHELQTPLAIVQGKIEMLAETDNLTEEQLRELDAIYTTLGRAVKLNKSLLLLARIENGQYKSTEVVDVKTMCDAIMDDLQEVYAHKQIHYYVTADEKHPFIISCNFSLAQIMLNNLLKNALQHSPVGGTLHLNICSNMLQIKNSGAAPLDGEKLFQRFYASRETASKDSNGLGLSIAYSIAKAASLDLTYRWENDSHVFSIVKECK